MSKHTAIWKSVFLLLAVMGTSLVQADTRGKIVGRVMDSSTGQPMPGVNVYIRTEQLGAVADADGYYYVLNIPPGLHTITASFIGYTIRTVQDVQVVSDQTTTLNFNLAATMLEGEEVVVLAKKPLVQADLTSSKTTITAMDLKVLPTESFQDLLATKAGVTLDAEGNLHIRGGRSSEILYMVDGIPVANPFSNALGLSISTNMISELTLISGTFNAEYGKAMSGVVNLITLEGGQRLKGEVRFQSGDRYSTNTRIFQDVDEFDPLSANRLDLNLSGPLPFVSDASFLIAGTLSRSKGWLYGWREHNTVDYGSFSAGEEAFMLMTGDSARVPMNPSQSQNMMAKLTFRPWGSSKLTYQFTGSESYYQKYEHQWKYNPDGRYKYESGNSLHALHFSQTVSGKTYFTIKGALKRASAEQYVHKLEVPYTWDETTYYTGSGDISRHDLNGDGQLSEITIDWEFLRDHGGFIPNPLWYTVNFDATIDDRDTTITIEVPNYVPNQTRTNVPSDHFIYGGQHTGYYLSEHLTKTLKFDLTSQITRSHQIRLGAETNWYRLYSNSINIQMSGGTFWQPYIQPASTSGPGHDEYVREPFDLSVYLQDKIELKTIILQAGIRFDYFNARDTTFSDANKTDPIRDQEATAKYQISPRLGVSFPITDQGYIHFSYGHFFQMPPFTYLYRNPLLKRYAGTSLLQYGNPDLDAMKATQYELGLQQQLSPTTAVDVTMFYRNIHNWLSSEYNFIKHDFRYTRYVTEDYGNIRGITMALLQRTNTGLALNVDYTYEIAVGNSSSPDAVYYDNLKTPPIESEKKVVPLEWDVRQTVNMTVAYITGHGLRISAITKFSSGLPYTPTVQGLRQAEENSGRKPFHLTTDLQGSKIFDIGGLRLAATFKVYNLFDRLNERYVFTDTGRATYSLRPTYAGDPAEHYPDLAGVHSIYENLYSPNNYQPPRQVLFSLGWSF